MYTWIDIRSPDDLDQLLRELGAEYNPPEVVNQLKGQLSEEVKGILLESHYVDKDYRSTYYEFYSKKGLRYSAFCVRLHFFKQGVTLTDDRSLQVTEGILGERYVGYMVLRPTPIAPIGRTVLSIHAKSGFAGAIIDGHHGVHLLGYPRLEVDGFPYMQQHTDISVCAHAVCWSILRHYNQRHRNYAEFLVADVTRMASAGNPGGLIPSRGLGIDQACRVFSRAGLYPDVYHKDEVGGYRFYRFLNAYVESGFPVFAALETRPHAITVIGQGQPDLDAFVGVSDSILFSWEAINSFVVVDDNYMPYLTIDCLDGGPYKITDIGTFIVPLPEKIYLPAEAVDKHVVHLLEYGFPELDLSHLIQPVVRYFVTTSAKLRAYARGQTALPRALFQILMDLALPQFVWVVQIASMADWRRNRCNVLCILDATASAYDEEPFFLIQDRRRAFVYDRGDSGEKGWVDFDQPLEFFGDFRLNLTYRT